MFQRVSPETLEFSTKPPSERIFCSSPETDASKSVVSMETYDDFFRDVRSTPLRFRASGRRFFCLCGVVKAHFAHCTADFCFVFVCHWRFCLRHSWIKKSEPAGRQAELQVGDSFSWCVISFRLSLCLYRRENRGSVAGFVPELRLLSSILSISDSVSFDKRGKTTGNLLPKTAITGILTADIFCGTIHLSAHG